MKNLLVLAFLGATAFAQTTNVKSICFTDGTGTPTNNCITANGFTKMNSTGIFAPLGNFDASGSTHTIPSHVGLVSGLPGTCTQGEEYFATDAFFGQNKYYCGSSNNWQQQRIQNQVLTNVANTYSAGAKQVFTPSASTSGFELACVTADPSTLVAGDLWCRSDQKLIKFYDGTTTQSFAITGNFVAAGIDATAGGQVTGLHLATTRSGDLVYYNGTSWTELAGNNFGVSNTVYFFGEGSTGVPSFSNNLTENTATSTMRYNGGGGISSGTVSADTSVSVGVGDPSCGSATGCFGAVEASTAGSPIAGHGYLRNDSGSHLFRVSTNGGSENYMPEATNIGSSGQIPIANGDGTYTVADPLVSFAPINLFNGQAITGTATSAFVRLSALGTSGTLWLTVAGIGTNGTTCTAVPKYADSLGNSFTGTTINLGSGGTISANGTTIYAVSPSNATLQNAAQIAVTFACGAYSSAGTFSMDFVPSLPTVNQNTTSYPLPSDIRKLNGAAVIGSNGLFPVADSTGAVMDAPLGGSAYRGRVLFFGINNSSGVDLLRGCDKTITGSDSASGSTQIIAGVSSKDIHICGLALSSSSTTLVAAKLVASSTSGNACATSPWDMSEAVPLQAIASNAPVGSNIFPSMSTDWSTANTNAGGSNAALCLNLSSANAVVYQVHYAQY